MFRPFVSCAILVLLLSSPPSAPAQLVDVASEHVRLRMPAERESLGRDLAAEIERCYLFMNRATGQKLPRKILIIVDWDQADSTCNRRDAAITLGMNQPAASTDLKGFLMHGAGKEIARLGLLGLSGGARREDTEFLFEGMSEILVHEYSHSTRSLEGAWVICRYLDEMNLLGLATQRSWTEFSSGKRCLRSAAPGITLLTTFRELQGRDTPLKLFEALKKKSLTASLEAAFKTSSPEVESIWLKRIREYNPPDEITIAGEEAPRLVQTTLIPGSARPGTILELRFHLQDRADNILPDGVFVRDHRTGRSVQAAAASEKGAGYMEVKIPVEANCPPGEYTYTLTAIDESGNLRRWPGSYKVGSR